MPDEMDVVLSWSECKLQKGTNRLLEVTWRPAKEEVCRHKLVFCDGKQKNRNIFIIFRSVELTFQNLLGTVHREGGLLFSPDGNCLISTVGNRITIFDLKKNKSNTLPVESRYNYVALDINANGSALLAINEEGEAHIISLISFSIVHRHRFNGICRNVKFSPDGKHVAVCKGNNVLVFKAPGLVTGTHNAFEMERVFHGAYDETTCLNWSSDSKILAVGSKDMATKLYSFERFKNFRMYSLGSHTDEIVGCFFEQESYDLITISRNGQTCVWECTVKPGELEVLKDQAPAKKKKTSDDNEEDDVDITKSVEKTQEEVEESLKESPECKAEDNKLLYMRLARHYLADEVRKEHQEAVLTAAAYHPKARILVTGFSCGVFFIYETPDMNLIHSLSISEQKISSIALNQTGEWVALGCSGIGQLLVWEWQSETHVMKQQSHMLNITCLSYSSDGHIVATGGGDGKVKLWKVSSGFCFVTFSEHSSAVTALAFCASKNFIVSSSLDGTVRAFDITRYRNFKTFTSPRLVQFSCVSVDSSGEFVAAGGQDVFEIYLWSVKTGRLLEILSGHEGPVSSVVFSPGLTSTTMASVSWDKTLRTWDAIEKGSSHEVIELLAEGVFVTFNPNGVEVAVATLDGRISVFEIRTATQVASIEGRNDLGSGRSDNDLITAKKTLEAKCFSTLCYSADGAYILAAGQSKNVCIYSVKENLLVRKFEITQNRSLDAVDDYINRRKLTEFGNMALIEERELREGGNVAIKLPGVRSGEMSKRTLKPEVRVLSLQFSPTGQQWAAATTEGLLIYALNSGIVFDPWDLQADITPMGINNALKDQDYLNALIMAVKMNEANHIRQVIETIPVCDVELIVSSLGLQFIKRLLYIFASALDASKHVQFYLKWLKHIMTIHGSSLVQQGNKPALVAVLQSVERRNEQLSKMCDYNQYMTDYVRYSQKTVVKTLDEDHDEMNGKSDLDSEDEDAFMDNSVLD
ncbi:periodic tryptophan protein 2 homolog isoform X1 [Dendroctonus ponderosae]|uniref:periodic tryptophan protein 2 homolog isoform X1 n=1 Tax=Dendroctonus ponderosae TaxID=77166 RepID=UPI002035B725|nr:periodic tryptophan protein 2 homolog isoform X1 [Dendroctonus ponderosae]KAH1025703.1 hypothetical protein HUJ05_010379 [Dendroctonus ponderosae]